MLNHRKVGWNSIHQNHGINSNDKLLGAIHILLRKEDADLDHNIIEIFIRQLGFFLSVLSIWNKFEKVRKD